MPGLLKAVPVKHLLLCASLNSEVYPKHNAELPCPPQNPNYPCHFEAVKGMRNRLEAEPTPAKLQLLKQQRCRPAPKQEQFGDDTKAGGARQTGKWGQILYFKYHFLKYLQEKRTYCTLRRSWCNVNRLPNLQCLLFFRWFG